MLRRFATEISKPNWQISSIFTQDFENLIVICFEGMTLNIHNNENLLLVVSLLCLSWDNIHTKMARPSCHSYGRKMLFDSRFRVCIVNIINTKDRFYVKRGLLKSVDQSRH